MDMYAVEKGDLDSIFKSNLKRFICRKREREREKYLIFFVK